MMTTTFHYITATAQAATAAKTAKVCFLYKLFTWSGYVLFQK